MSARLRVVCSPEAAPGIALAGIVAEPVHEGGEADATISDLLRGREPDIVLLQEQLYDALPPGLRARVDRSATPVVVPFPGPSWAAPLSAEARVVELLRRAIGYRVKLR